MHVMQADATATSFAFTYIRILPEHANLLIICKTNYAGMIMSVIQDYYNDRYYAWSITLKKVSNITDRLILSYPLSVFH